MSRRKKVGDVELANLPSAPLLMAPTGGADLTPTEERRERELDDVLSEIGTDMRVRIWHIIDGKPSWAGEMGGDGFTLDALLDVYGGGEKTLKIMQGKAVRETVRVSLDPSVPPRNPRTPKGVPQQPNGSGAGVGVDALLSAVGAMMTMQAQATNTMMTALATMAANRPTERDTVGDFVKMAEVLKPAPVPPASASVTEAFALFEKGMNMATKLNGDGGDGIMPVVGEGLKVVTKLAEGYADEKRAALARSRVAPALPQGGARPATGDVSLAETETGGGSLPLAGSSGRDARTDPGADVTARVADRPADRPWVKAARPYATMLQLMAGRLEPPTAADNIAQLLGDDDGAFSDLITDIETGRHATDPASSSSGTVWVDGGAFVDRACGYFGWAATGEMRTWLAQLATELLALVDDDDTDAQTTDNTGGVDGKAE